MSQNESTARRDPSVEEAGDRTSKQWVVGPRATGCDHPKGALTRLGGDGLNGYYQCGRCGAGFVVQDEVADLV